MATLKEKLETLSEVQRKELCEALGVELPNKNNNNDFAAAISKLADRITKLEKPDPPEKKEKKTNASWWDTFWASEV
jgi:acyl-CoA synthetase (NDP forming)